jgi:hypothetical protein
MALLQRDLASFVQIPSYKRATEKEKDSKREAAQAMKKERR